MGKTISAKRLFSQNYHILTTFDIEYFGGVKAVHGQFL